VIVEVGHLDDVVADGIKRVMLITVAVLGGRHLVEVGVRNARTGIVR
jgi:hypothetical protein